LPGIITGTIAIGITVVGITIIGIIIGIIGTGAEHHRVADVSRAPVVIAPSFRGASKRRTRNLEIPGSRFACPGMTERVGYANLTSSP
jgi:hypothetical protein